MLNRWKRLAARRVIDTAVVEGRRTATVAWKRGTRLFRDIHVGEPGQDGNGPTTAPEPALRAATGAAVVVVCFVIGARVGGRRAGLGIGATGVRNRT